MDAGETWLSGLLDPGTSIRSVVAGELRRPAWDQGRRTLDDHMLHAVLEGGHEGTVGGLRVRTRPGDLLWVPAGTAQDLHLAAGEPRLHKVYVRFSALRGGRRLPWPAGEPVSRPVAGAVVEAMRSAVRLHAMGGPSGGPRLRAFLVLVFSAWFDAAAHVPGTLDAVRRGRLADLVAADPGRHDGRTLARALGLSPLTLARLARRTWGVPLRTWILRHRLRLAAEDLRASSESVAAIAARHGWADPLLFSRQFRRHLGTTATAWRAG